MGTLTNNEDIVCYGKTKNTLKNYSLKPLDIYTGPSQV